MSIEGTWNLVIDSRIGKQKATLVLLAEGNTLTGTLTNPARKITQEIFDGSVSGDELSWKAKIMGFTVTFTAVVTGDTMTGKAQSGPAGTIGMSGERESSMTPGD